MNLFDSFSDGQEEYTKNMLSNVFQHFVTGTLERNGLIASGPNAGGNLSQAQIKAGMRPVEQNVIPNSNGSTFNSQSGGMLGMDKTTTWIIIGGAVVVIGVLLLRR